MDVRIQSESGRRLRRVQQSLLSQQPFFASLTYRTPLIATPQTDTVACDGETMWYNPNWVMETNADQVRATMARLVVACSLKHHTRRGERDYDRWNYASYLATVPFIRDAGLTDDPAGIDAPVERIYQMLGEQQSDQEGGGNSPQYGSLGLGGGNGAGPGKSGEQPGDGITGNGDAAATAQRWGMIWDAPLDYSDQAGLEGKIREAEQGWDDFTLQAAASARSEGKMPGQFAEYINASLNTRVDWRTLLRRFMTDNGKRDYSWSPPNYRFIASRLYLPSLTSRELHSIVFAVDTSGSLDRQQLETVWSEIQGAAHELTPESVRVMQCDTTVRQNDEFRLDDLPDTIQIVGRGGTMYSPVFRAVDELDHPPAFLIYLTDLYCSDYPKPEPSYPVLWAVTGNAPDSYHPPFGEVIRLDD